MKPNIGIQGRILRLVIAILLFAYAIWQGSWVAFAFAIFTLYEAVASWCVVYQLLGRNSCPIDPNRDDTKR